MAELVKRWPRKLPVHSDIYAMLCRWKSASGFHTPRVGLTLSDLLTMDISADWPSLLHLCTQTSKRDLESLRFSFSLMIFGNAELEQYLHTLLAFASCPQLRDEPFPEQNSYDLAHGHHIGWNVIEKHMRACKLEFEPMILSDSETSDASDTDTGECQNQEHIDTQNEALRAQYLPDYAEQSKQIKDIITSEWPTESILLPPQAQLTTFRRQQLQELINASLVQWCRNLELYVCCRAYEESLRTVNTPLARTSMPDLSVHLPLPVDHSSYKIPTLSCLVGVVEVPQYFEQTKKHIQRYGFDSTVQALHCKRIAATRSERNVTKESEDSLQSIVQHVSSNDGLTDDTIKKYSAHGEAQDRVNKLLETVKEAVRPRDNSSLSLQRAGLWPEVTQLALLRLLSRQRRSCLTPQWMELLLAFGQAVTALQRVERVQEYVEIDDKFALRREIENRAHGAWNIAKYPDWLLLEIQNDMLVRPVQVRVAEEIISNRSGSLMLGMGEGKTSVILPMVITVLADGKKLLRVIVLKSLASEMLRSLSLSLAGLVDRYVYYIPFSRHTKLNQGTPHQLQGLYEECKSNCGVLLTLHEYLNSFRLIGSDRLSNATDKDLSRELLMTQKWLDANSRDVMDECDEILKPSYELVYTNGEAKLLQGAPYRWDLILELFDLVSRHAVAAEHESPKGIEVEDRGTGNFPHIRITSPEGFDALARYLLEDILQDRLMGMPLSHCGHEVLLDLQAFIRDPVVPKKSLSSFTRRYGTTPFRDSLYLLRGLFAKGILWSALSKRWHVNYGLDRGRCLSAVPYRAKSVPSLASEFAQPEMMLCLTALSFYYEGLSLVETRACLVRLYKNPDPADEYSKWTSLSSVPPDLRKLSSVNIEDESCISKLHIHLRTNKALVDYFLRYFVFAKEAKEFPYKLSTSAWDLCSNEAGKKTSGFSGTGDSMLPLTMPQKDLPDLRHTAASVLRSLLRPENQTYTRAAGDDNKRLEPDSLLRLITDQAGKPAVIIDVGAQFLASNHDIAVSWLGKRSDKHAVVYFDDKDQKVVYDRSQQIQRWTSSPYCNQPGACLFLLDEFHTRGTDFKFPDEFCGAVLLGSGLQKDALVQACMRMRKLAFGQSVVFLAPPEVDTSIRSLKSDASSVTSYDVVLWTMKNSCRAIRSQTPLWLMRGLAHAQRKHAFSSHVGDDGRVMNKEVYIEKLREPESRSLEDLYSAAPVVKEHPYHFTEDEKNETFTSRLLEKWDMMDESSFCDRGNDEEQEREILHEVEQEREIQRPRKTTPCVPTFNVAPSKAICGEKIDITEAKVMSWSVFLQKETSLRKKPLSGDFGHFASLVWVTDDFRHTIRRDDASAIDDYLRSPQWVLKLHAFDCLFLLSPYEAQKFLPNLRNSKTAVLMIYAARTTKEMASFDKLDVYQIPTSSTTIRLDSDALTSLRLFSGQLYFNNYAEYQAFCELLGLWDGRRALEPGSNIIAADLFVSPACRTVNGWRCDFSESPVEYVRHLINMRRHGIEWSHTHVGRVLNGQVLTERDFEGEQKGDPAC